MNISETKSATSGGTVLHEPAPGTAPAAGRMLQFTVRNDGICVLTFDRPNSAANIFDRATLDELAAELDFIGRQTKLEGLVLVSAKPAIFIAGADLKTMREDATPDQIRELIERGQAVFNRLAALRIPTVAAIHGAAVGGGYEICLACDYRIASPERATKIGLPETQIGLLPAWGSSTRLPRLIGLPKALDLILAGKTVPARLALKLGLVDELAPKEYLLAAAVRRIREGKPRRSAHRLTNNLLAVSLVAPRVRRRLLKKTRGHYPAVLKALEVVTRGLRQPLETSLALERDAFVEVARTDACHNLIRLFFERERARKRTLPSVASPAAAKKIERTAVIGAGVMGAGIAQWISAHQLPVILRDLNAELVSKGMTSIAKIYSDGIRHHVFTPREARDGLDHVYPAPAEVPLRQTDIVIEAAVENLELKKQIFRRLDELVSDETILATNTSALPVSEIAAATRHPERVVGLHFFNPVHRMQLVEIVAAPRTAPEVVRRALRFAQQIGKLPVVVKDSPGFLVNRILMPYLIEAGNLFESGAKIEDLDEAMLEFGMPMGPLRLLDEVGLDVALHVAETLAASFSNRMNVPACLRKIAADGLLGRKRGRGFYLHEKAREARPNPQLSACIQSDKASALSRLELQERLVFLMVNEAARCLEEHVCDEPADVDFAMVMGTGFAPFRGGPLRHTDAVGAAKLAGAMEFLVANGAAHFNPCRLLAEMADNGKKFYLQD